MEMLSAVFLAFIKGVPLEMCKIEKFFDFYLKGCSQVRS